MKKKTKMFVLVSIILLSVNQLLAAPAFAEQAPPWLKDCDYDQNGNTTGYSIQFLNCGLNPNNVQQM